MFKTEKAKKFLGEHANVLNPALLWKWFLWTTEIPRGSGKCELIKSELLKVGKELGLETRFDAVGNVCITKPATAGYESAPGVIVQSHADMVIAHDPAVRVGFNGITDGIEAEMRGEWIHAKGTSLGADDGIGVATCLAILEGAIKQHPMIDCLFTVDEETTMLGANSVERALLNPKGNFKYLINVDSEDDGMLCLGCAGGETVTIRFNPRREPTNSENEAALTVSIQGFKGGHTGVDIQKYRANAIKILCELLSNTKCAMKIDGMEGGLYCNAIPIAAAATVVTKKSDIEKVRGKLLTTFEEIRSDLMGVDDVQAMKIDIASSPLPSKAVCLEDTKKIFNFWALAPCEPLRMSQELAGFVESSCAFTIAKLANGEGSAEFSGLARTSRDSQWLEIDRKLQALSEIVGGSLELTDKFSGWLPQPNSTLAKVATIAHKKAVGKECQVFSIHAGLECGIIMKKVPGLEAISIGPKVENPHTTNERCKVSTVTEYFNWLEQILKDLN